MTLKYYNLAAISGGNSDSIYKEDYPEMNNDEFILLCKDRLKNLQDEIIINGEVTELLDKAFVLIYELNLQVEINRAIFKYDISGAYSKPLTTTGQQVYTLIYLII